MTRKSADAPLVESRQIIELNGKPVAPGHEVHLPVTFRGAFGDALEIFFAPSLRPCFDFLLSPTAGADGSQRIDFTAHPGSASDPACASTPPRVAGFVRIDPATRHIRHLERTVPDDFARQRHVAAFASIDYAPTPVGDESLWLPTEITARIGARAVFTARYTNYHRFTGSITILPGLQRSTPPPSRLPRLAAPATSPPNRSVISWIGKPYSGS